MAGRKIKSGVVGGSSLITIFAVLCLIAFTMLSLSTAKSDHDLMEKSVNAVENYYKADEQAEEILAQIRAGNNPENVSRNKNQYSYSVPIDDAQELSVSVTVKEDGSYHIDSWQKKYTGEWKSDSSIMVWGDTQIDE